MDKREWEREKGTRRKKEKGKKGRGKGKSDEATKNITKAMDHEEC